MGKELSMNRKGSWWLGAFGCAASALLACSESPFLVLAQDDTESNSGAMLGLASSRAGLCIELTVDSGTISTSTPIEGDNDDDDDKSEPASVKAAVPESGPVRFVVRESESSVVVRAVLHADDRCSGDYVLAADDEVFTKSNDAASSSSGTGGGGSGAGGEGGNAGAGGASSGSAVGGAGQGGATSEAGGGSGGEGGA